MILDPRERLIVALDVSSASAAQKIVADVGDSAFTYKVGMQLYTAEGPRVVRDLVASGRRVFLDLKFHDIPNTVSAAVAEAAKLGISMLTVHATGGSKMLRAAADAAGSVNPGLLVLGVTVLTSMNDADLEEVGVPRQAADQVLRLASLVMAAGCRGVVASPLEAAALRRHLGAGLAGEAEKHFAIVTPGVRPAGSEAGDQSRFATPAAAIAGGASHIVVGRPITAAAHPAAAAQAILQELASLHASQPA